MSCPSDNINVSSVDFWNQVDRRIRIAWYVSVIGTAIACVVTLLNIFTHARTYTNPKEQRQIIRIIVLPVVYAVISMVALRYFSNYIYFQLAQDVYEAIALGAFLFLMLEYFSAISDNGSIAHALKHKDKRPLPLFSCLRYRPSKAYFVYALKWAVLQYCIVRPMLSIIAAICQSRNVLCESAGFNFHYAYPYIQIFSLLSMTIAIYALLLFYGLTKEELKNRNPLLKFLSIKLVIGITLVQAILFNIIAKNHFDAENGLWTETDYANALDSVATCVEMVIFAVVMLRAYSAKEYTYPGAPATSIIRPVLDAINPYDFIHEIFTSLMFFVSGGKPRTHGHTDEKGRPRKNFAQVFGTDDVPGANESQIPLTPAIQNDYNWVENGFRVPVDPKYENTPPCGPPNVYSQSQWQQPPY